MDKRKNNIKKTNLVVDIGSNDGTCLDEFKKHAISSLWCGSGFFASKIANKRHMAL